MPRPTWQGHLRLSLVTCPVALYRATSEAGDVHFHLINPKTNNRIRMVPTDPDKGPVERKDLVKGYELSKNRYVLLNKRELDAVKLDSTRVLDIERFVEAADIDRIWWDQPYYLGPDGKTGTEAFAVIQHAMEQSGKIALGRLVMHSRERICALEPRGPGMLLTTLRAHDEVVSIEEVLGRKSPARPTREMLSIADKIIEQQSGAFKPSEFKDRYEDALRALIKRKQKGEKLVSAEPVEERANVVDLMKALRQSLEGERGPTKQRAERYIAARSTARRPRRRTTTKTKRRTRKAA
jgi:DNA end-binding protein Ku